jgi:hypothetical protein
MLLGSVLGEFQLDNKKPTTVKLLALDMSTRSYVV